MTGTESFHESFDHTDDVRAGSERAFGVVFAVVFALVSLWPLLDGLPIRLWALVVSGAFLLAALLKPRILSPLNRLWFRFGLVLHKIVNPLVMGLLFFLTVTPIALIMRLVGKDPLRRNFDSEATSYWIARDPEELASNSMRNQF